MNHESWIEKSLKILFQLKVYVLTAFQVFLLLFTYTTVSIWFEKLLPMTLRLQIICFYDDSFEYKRPTLWINFHVANIKTFNCYWLWFRSWNWRCCSTREWSKEEDEQSSNGKEKFDDSMPVSLFICLSSSSFRVNFKSKLVFSCTLIICLFKSQC